jgi:hypothetical protein
MVLMAIPIAMPTDRLLRENVIMSGANVANCPISAASSELRGPIAALALHLREPIVLDRSIVSGAREIIARVGAVESAVIVAERTKTICAVTLECSRISIVLESGHTIAPVESSRRKLALAD